jgi:hypothetical protein
MIVVVDPGSIPGISTNPKCKNRPGSPRRFFAFCELLGNSLRASHLALWLGLGEVGWAVLSVSEFVFSL